jgi:hypothetical protein
LRANYVIVLKFSLSHAYHYHLATETFVPCPSNIGYVVSLFVLPKNIREYYSIQSFDQQYNRCRVSVSQTEEQIRSHFNGLVAYLDINLNLNDSLQFSSVVKCKENCVLYFAVKTEIKITLTK